MLIAIGVIIAIIFAYSWNTKLGIGLALLAGVVLFSKWKG